MMEHTLSKKNVIKTIHKEMLQIIWADFLNIKNYTLPDDKKKLPNVVFKNVLKKEWQEFVEKGNRFYYGDEEDEQDKCIKLDTYEQMLFRIFANYSSSHDERHVLSIDLRKIHPDKIKWTSVGCQLYPFVHGYISLDKSIIISIVDMEIYKPNVYRRYIPNWLHAIHRSVREDILENINNYTYMCSVVDMMGPNYMFKDNMTLLHYCVMNYVSNDIIKMIIESGGDPNIKNLNGYSPIDMCTLFDLSDEYIQIMSIVNNCDQV